MVSVQVQSVTTRLSFAFLGQIVPSWTNISWPVSMSSSFKVLDSWWWFGSMIEKDPYFLSMREWPDGRFGTYILVEPLSKWLCGTLTGTHFILTAEKMHGVLNFGGTWPHLSLVLSFFFCLCMMFYGKRRRIFAVTLGIYWTVYQVLFIIECACADFYRLMLAPKINSHQFTPLLLSQCFLSRKRRKKSKIPIPSFGWNSNP